MNCIYLLKAAIQIGAYMLEKFYPSRVIGRLTISEEEFWEEKVSREKYFLLYIILITLL